MSGSINLFGPSTVPGALPLTPGAIQAAVNAALSTKLSLASLTTATGAIIPRSLADRAADVISAKDFGAVLDGAGNDTAGLQAARNAITSGGRIYVGPGTVFSSPVTLPAASTAIWDISAKTPSGFNAYLPKFGTDIVHATNIGEWWYQLATSAVPGSGTGPIMRIDRAMTHAGGSGWSMVQLNDSVAAGANPGGQTTTLTIGATLSSAIATQPYVGIFQRGTRALASVQPMYGANFEVADDTGVPHNVAHIGVEWDILGNGQWLNQQAGVHDVVLKRSNSFPAGTAFRANFGIRVGNWTSALAEGGFDYPFLVGNTNVYIAAFGGTPTVAAGASFFDASAASFLGSPVALRLAANQLIEMEATGQHTLYFDAATSKWFYDVAGVHKFSVDTTGNARFAGTVTPSVAP